MLPEADVFAHFHFLRPGFALLLLPWIAILVLQRRRYRARERFDGIIATHLLEHLRLRGIAASWFNPRSITTVFSLLMLVVLMGPSWRQQPSPLHEDEAALVIALDLSHSMTQNDIQPTRLDRARQKIADLLALRPGKRAALIVYAGSAHTVLSLTTDSDILNRYLAAVSGDIIPRAGKFPEHVLPQVDRILRQNTAPATLVLFTDGPGADSAQAFERYFSERPHQLVIVGTGTENVSTGNAPLEKAALQALTRRAGGHYVDLTVDERDMRRVNRRIDSHFVVRQDSALPWHDSGYLLLFPAAALFLLWFRRGWTLTWSVVLLPLVLATPAPGALADDGETVAHPNGPAQWFADLWLTPDQQGRLLLQLGRAEQAAHRFEDPLWKGVAHYYAGNFMLAAEYFSRSESPTALFNEANARAHARDYLRALARYDRVLAAQPEFTGAAENRARVQALVDEINRLSASQQDEPGVSSEEKSADGSDPIPAQGADTLDWQREATEQYTAEALLNDPQLIEMWLRGVNHDPANFLATKFNMQLEAQPPREVSQ